MTMTIKMKALLLAIPVLVVVSLVHTYISIKTEQALVRSEIKKRAETITTLATKTGELPILSGNCELLKGTVSFLKDNSEVASVTFYDAHFRQLIHDGAPVSRPLPPISAQRPISIFEEGDQIIYVAPVFTERTQEVEIFQDPEQVTKVRENIGWIRLGFSKRPMQQHERRILVQGAMLAAAFSLGSSLLLYFLISIAMRPVSRMVSVANGIAHGDLDREIPEGQSREMATLAQAFGTMKNTIAQVLRETETLIAAVREGRLEVRSNSAPFKGEWRKLVAGVNELTDAFGKAHEDLRQAKDAAEAADRAKTGFIANMSHELRTPLNAILGYAQVLGQQNLSPQQARQVEVMRGSGEHLLALINDILDIGRMESDKVELQEHPFQPALLLQQVMDIIAIQAQRKGLRLACETAGTLPHYLNGDEMKLRQILLNLLNNAVKYTTRGSVTLRAGYLGGIFWCEVIDTGIGIALEKQENVFEPFVQLAGDRQVREGTGLGLTIVRRLAALMGGKVGVVSEAGAGSTFRLEIPVSPAAVSPSAPVEVSVQDAGREQEGESAGAVQAPPREELEELHRLALLGDMRRISAFAARLGESGVYAPFVASLSELAASFRTKAIVELVERQLAEGAG